MKYVHILKIVGRKSQICHVVFVLLVQRSLSKKVASLDTFRLLRDVSHRERGREQRWKELIFAERKPYSEATSKKLF